MAIERLNLYSDSSQAWEKYLRQNFIKGNTGTESIAEAEAAAEAAGVSQIAADCRHFHSRFFVPAEQPPPFVRPAGRETPREEKSDASESNSHYHAFGER